MLIFASLLFESLAAASIPSVLVFVAPLLRPIAHAKSNSLSPLLRRPRRPLLGWVQPIDATCLNLRSVVTMARSKRSFLTTAEKTELWTRWSGGEGVPAIARALGRHPMCVWRVLKTTGGIAPPHRTRAAGAIDAAAMSELRCCWAKAQVDRSGFVPLGLPRPEVFAPRAGVLAELAPRCARE